MMNQLLSLFLSATLILSSSSVLATVQSNKPQTETVLSNQYIIKLKPSASTKTISTFLADYNAKFPVEGGGVQNVIRHTYSPKVFNGFAGTFSPKFLAELKAKYGSRIAYIEPNRAVHVLAPAGKRATPQADNPRAQDSQDSPPSWGLTRISQRDLDLSAPFLYPTTAGKGAEAWIVDTGCHAENPEFEGRATMVKSFIDGEDATDMNGHGTHVSGTIGSKTYGIAKSVTIKCVKVLDKDGSGTYEGVIAGIDFVTQNAAKNKSVMNMSLGGPKSQAVDDAVAAAVKAGVVIVVAAGNESQDACNVSPAGAKGIMAVGATDRTDTLADFSNVGSCVGILAPGVDITSLWIGDQATNTISGTSMASPHVVGVTALLLGENSYDSVDAVYADLKKLSTSDKIQNVDQTTVNKMVFDNAS